MKIHHIRSATFIIESHEHVILIDPMLGSKGTIPPFAFFRHKPRKNPYVELPSNTDTLLQRVTQAIITHLHPDHLDDAGVEFLKSNNIPVTFSVHDEEKLKNKGLNIVAALEYHKKSDFIGGKITGIPARYGYGFVSKLMGHVMGFFIKLENDSSIYISSDTIYTNEIDRVFEQMIPDVSVLAAGSAQFDLGKPLLMNVNDIEEFIQRAPKMVYANHLETVNHCPTTRADVRAIAAKNNLTTKVYVPEDGESFEV